MFLKRPLLVSFTDCDLEFEALLVFSSSSEPDTRRKRSNFVFSDPGDLSIGDFGEHGDSKLLREFEALLLPLFGDILDVLSKAFGQSSR